MSNKPRCGFKMQERRDGDIDPVCVGPFDHSPGRHVSKRAWLARKRRSAKQYERLLLKRQEWNERSSGTTNAPIGVEAIFTALAVTGTARSLVLSGSGDGICSEGTGG